MTMIKQAGLDPFLQNHIRDLTQLFFPEDAKNFEVPMVFTLPAGIHPYNKVAGYYCAPNNSIVVYQQFSRNMFPEGQSAFLSKDIELLLVHELAHWHQRKVQQAICSSSTAHSHTSWSKACHHMTQVLFGDKYDWDFFRPLISERNDENKVRKKQRPGALTPTELRHFPRCIPGFAGSLQTKLNLAPILTH